VAVLAGDHRQLAAVAVRADGTREDVTSAAGMVWASEDPQTATIDSNGNLVGVKAGSTHITASFGGATTSVVVTVVP
jgi:uncharacterized protein YjdB